MRAAAGVLARTRRLTSVLLAAALVGSGCFGRFQITRNVPRQPPQAQRVPSSDGSALYVGLAPDALLAWDERGELLARVTDVDGRAALVGGSLLEP